jgi:perosamine synthetase
VSGKIPWALPHLFGNESANLLEAIESTWISGGRFVDDLERRLSEHLESPHVVSTSNGTTALHLAYLALGIGPGDEVIGPGFAFAAPANMTLALGATPVFADVDPDHWCLDPEQVANLITPNTKAIIAVHTYGNVCDMDALLALGKEHGVAVVEDTAEALFSRYRGKWAGAIGDLGSLSFQATKTITTGEGGAVLTADSERADLMRLIRNHGMRERRYFHSVVGHNFRLTNLQAALGCAQLDNLEEILAAKRRVYEGYRERLSDLEGVSLQGFCDGVDPLVWVTGVRLDPEAFGPRDAVMAAMSDAGVETRPGFYPFHAMPIYPEAPVLPVSEDLANRVITLPSHFGLGSEDVARVCDALQAARRS